MDRCCGKDAKAREEDLKEQVAVKKPLISTDFLLAPAVVTNEPTVIQIWGDRALVHPDAVLQADPEGYFSDIVDPTAIVASAKAEILARQQRAAELSYLRTCSEAAPPPDNGSVAVDQTVPQRADDSGGAPTLGGETLSKRSSRSSLAGVLPSDHGRAQVHSPDASPNRSTQRRSLEESKPLGESTFATRQDPLLGAAAHKHAAAPPSVLDPAQAARSFDSRVSVFNARAQPETVPICFRSLSDKCIVKAVVGTTHMLLLDRDGVVFVFGTGDVGQLGLGKTILFTTRPVQLDFGGPVIVKEIACGSKHSVALTVEGEVFTWGDADCLGTGAAVDAYRPVLLGHQHGLKGRVTVIAARFSQTMAGTESSSVYVWGETFFSYFNVTPHLHFTFDRVHGGIKEISIGRQFAMVLLNDGRLYSWGDGTYMELGRAAHPKEARAVSTRRLLPLPVNLSQDSIGSVIPRVKSVACGTRHTLLLSEDGRVWAFGDNLAGQCGLATHLLSRQLLPKPVKMQVGDKRLFIRAIAAGYRHNAALTDKNHLLLWGHSSNHKLIHTAPQVQLLEEKFGIGPGHMGIALKSGIKDCVHRPTLTYAFLHRSVSCVALGENFTVVVLGRCPETEKSRKGEDEEDLRRSFLKEGQEDLAGDKGSENNTSAMTMQVKAFRRGEGDSNDLLEETEGDSSNEGEDAGGGGGGDGEGEGEGEEGGEVELEPVVGEFERSPELYNIVRSRQDDGTR